MQRLAGEERDVAVGDEDRSLEVLREDLGHTRLPGPSLVLVDDDHPGVDLGDVSGDVALVADHHEVLRGHLAGRGDRVAQQGAPGDAVQDLGVADFIRVPSPAARTMTAARREVFTRRLQGLFGCHRTASCYRPVMGGPCAGHPREEASLPGCRATDPQGHSADRRGPHLWTTRGPHRGWAGSRPRPAHRLGGAIVPPLVEPGDHPRDVGLRAILAQLPWPRSG